MTDMDAVQRVTRATCAALHDRDIASGLITRPQRDPGQYRWWHVFPVVLAAMDARLVPEAPHG